MSPRWVLTAAHCAPVAFVGIGPDIDAMERQPVAELRRHPSAAVDLLLIRVETPFAVPAVSLSAGHRPPRGFVRMVGFGARDSNGRLGVGRKSYVDLAIDGWGCDGGRSQRLGCAAHELVMMRNTAGDTCNGDSGGPVFATGPDGEQLIAVTSRGVPVPGKACGQGGIYTRTDLFEPWISNIIGGAHR